MNACYRWCSATLPKSFNLRYPFLHHSTAAQQGLKAGVLTSSLSPSLLAHVCELGLWQHLSQAALRLPLSTYILHQSSPEDFPQVRAQAEIQQCKNTLSTALSLKKQTYQVIQEGEVGGSCAFHSAVLLFKHLQGVYSLEGECLKLLLLSYSSIQRLGQGSVWTEDRGDRGAAVSSSRQLAGGKFHSRTHQAGKDGNLRARNHNCIKSTQMI